MADCGGFFIPKWLSVLCDPSSMVAAEEKETKDLESEHRRLKSMLSKLEEEAEQGEEGAASNEGVVTVRVQIPSLSKGKAKMLSHPTCDSHGWPHDS